MARDIKLIREDPGTGSVVENGATAIYNARFFLPRGEEVTMDAATIERNREHVTVRIEEGIELIDHATRVGSRQAIAAVEKGLTGMRVGGFREIKATPQLCYGDRGTGTIPRNTPLVIQLWVRDVVYK